MNKIPALVAAATCALLLAGCASNQAQIAPLMGSAQPSAAESAPAFPDADEEAFLALVERDWQGPDVTPATEDLLAAGYERCAVPVEEREPTDSFYPQWSGPNNMVVLYGAEYHLCPTQ